MTGRAPRIPAEEFSSSPTNAATTLTSKSVLCRRELFYKRRLERDAALHIHDAASVERIFVRAENFAELVSVEGVFCDVAVDGHVHDVVVAHHEHRALRRFRRVDARDEGLQRVRRALERRLRRYQMRGVLREVGQLFEPRAQPRAGRALLGAP